MNLRKNQIVTLFFLKNRKTYFLAREIYTELNFINCFTQRSEKNNILLI